METGDIVIIQDKDAPRGSWKLGRVVKAFKGIDNKVREIEIQYRNDGHRDFTTIQRSVQKVIVILPANNREVKANLKSVPPPSVLMISNDSRMVDANRS